MSKGGGGGGENMAVGASRCRDNRLSEEWRYLTIISPVASSLYDIIIRET